MVLANTVEKSLGLPINVILYYVTECARNRVWINVAICTKNFCLSVKWRKMKRLSL